MNLKVLKVGSPVRRDERNQLGAYRFIQGGAWNSKTDLIQENGALFSPVSRSPVSRFTIFGVRFVRK